MISSVTTLVIPIGGKGSRLGSITRATHKEWVPVYSEPAISWVIREAEDAGIEKVILVTSNCRDRISRLEEFFRHNKSRPSSKLPHIDIVPENESRGAGGAVLNVKDRIPNDSAFAVAMPDDLILPYGDERHCLTHMIRCYEQYRASVVPVEIVSDMATSRYGIVEAFPQPSECSALQIRQLVEKPPVGTAPSNLAIAGRYLFTADVWEALEATPASPNGEIQLTDALNRLVQSGIPARALCIEGKRYDCGHPIGLIEANLAFARRFGTREEIKTLKEAIVASKLLD